jgi:hypothetical protein
MDARKRLRVVKITHTIVWAFFASCILALPVAAITGHLRWAFALTVVVLCECAVLLANRWRCPLTDVASRYTDDRADNFDIYLPKWLARNNKEVFGTLFAAGELVLLWCWLR